MPVDEIKKISTDSVKKIKDISGLIDKAVFPGLQGGPHLNQIAAVAVALEEASKPAFRAYAKQVIKNAKTLATELQKLGWHVISGGTDSHMVLLDTWMGGQKVSVPDALKQADALKLKGKAHDAYVNMEVDAGGISGKEASDKLERAGIIVNKNTIPGETRSAVDPSGIRLGTAAETTRGKKESDFKKIAEKIDQILRADK